MVPDDNDDVPPSAATQQACFMRNSTDNINVRFVSEEKPGESYMFNAGGAPLSEDTFIKAKQRSRSAYRELVPELRDMPSPGAGGRHKPLSPIHLEKLHIEDGRGGPTTPSTLAPPAVSSLRAGAGVIERSLSEDIRREHSDGHQGLRHPTR